VGRPNIERILSAQDAVSLYAMLAERGVRCWITGGWGVDALLGRETRPHHDLDVLVGLDSLSQLQDVLAEQGFTRSLEWEENRWVDQGGVQRPTAFVETDTLGRELDIHIIEVLPGRAPVALYDHDWNFDHNALDGVGSILGTRVACVSAATQLRAHTGYDLPRHQQADVERLCRLVDQQQG
jgi:lincosamide nucleotidyltransferase A/C/D/E